MPSRKRSGQRGLTDPSESSFHKIYLDYRRKAELRNLPFLLTRAQFKRITKQRCYYCNSPPARAYKTANGRAPYNYNGVDRLDPVRGYQVGNVVAACWTCNNMKSNSTFKAFVTHLSKITAHLLTRLPTPFRKARPHVTETEQSESSPEPTDAD